MPEFPRKQIVVENDAEIAMNENDMLEVAASKQTMKLQFMNYSFQRFVIIYSLFSTNLYLPKRLESFHCQGKPKTGLRKRQLSRFTARQKEISKCGTQQRK